MSKEMTKTDGGHISPFERIKRTNDAGMEFWSSRDFSEVLGYGDYRNFEGVIEKAQMACFNSGHRIEDHFVDVTEMVAIAHLRTRFSVLASAGFVLCLTPAAEIG